MPNLLANATQFIFFVSNINFGFFPTATSNISFLRIVEKDSQIVPSNITVSNITTTGNITFSVAGIYGEDIAADSIYEVVSNVESNATLQFTDYDTLNATTYEHLFVFSPDPFEIKTMNLMFTANNFTSVIHEQIVLPDHSRHRERCIYLIDKEAPNRG